MYGYRIQSIQLDADIVLGSMKQCARARIPTGDPLSATSWIGKSLLRILLSLLASGVSIVTVLGLLAAPTDCACGIGMPHAHSLFMLAGHHHSASGKHMNLNMQRGTSDRVQAARSESGPRVTAITGHRSHQIAYVPAAFQSITRHWRRLKRRFLWSLLSKGRTKPPDPPPPKHRPRELMDGFIA